MRIVGGAPVKHPGCRNQRLAGYCLTPLTFGDVVESNDDTPQIFQRPPPTSEAPVSDGELETYARRDDWTALQAVCLSLGIAPNGNWIAQPAKDGDVEFDSPFRLKGGEAGRTVLEVNHRMKLVAKAIYDGTLSQKLEPAAFIHWAMRHFDHVSERVRDATLRTVDAKEGGLSEKLLQAQLKIAQLEAANAELGQLADAVKGFTIETALKLAAAMATNLYSFRVEAQRNRAVTAICKATQKFGVGLDRTTVLKYLRRGVDLFPADKRIDFPTE
jgi:hypothetical protein